METGIFFDWWWDARPDRRAPMEAVRAQVPPGTLVLVNANANPLVETADLVNGSFMEADRSANWSAWAEMEASLVHNERHAREPRINAISAWFEQSRNEPARVRAVTTLALTRSDGFVLFSDPNPLPTPDHLHDWYPLWDQPLGRALGPGREHPDGGVRRLFTGGLAVYNRPGAGEATVRLESPHRSFRTGRVGLLHTVPAADH
ncbi:hypothetical protein [Phycisphaera mikurensis]|uniref:Uncharacterized protein n=1 Tax=Phycisphaera mikurensis (strain NBRC 102666 / KCTC 22515 / FYK2301M01) TaxID=1142394 RepID=I0ICT7_PHYMF|nr:hypothetical protein [Phycisphaera mikurensis]MBB6443306.1 hypothetical protein [Phycisphaera mikurensis]BAM03075.1 hypothetical protein PSMK_09160 [Phycisphaera mikurensis NBRC 102666]